MEFQKPKTILSLNTDVTNGSYALDDVPLSFETCRERFAARFKQTTPGLYFKHEPERGEDVAAFLLKTEDIVGVEKSRFSKTNHNTILWIEHSSFWKSCSMRRSLLTILLRAGILYDRHKDNYEDVLFSQEFVKVTKKAVMRFLFGFTKYVGPEIIGADTVIFQGWKSIFEGKNETDIKSFLVKPDGANTTPDILQDALWI